MKSFLCSTTRIIFYSALNQYKHFAKTFSMLEHHQGHASLWKRLLGQHKKSHYEENGQNSLTHWGRGEMNILQTKFSNIFSSVKMFKISIKISLKFVPKGPINNVPALIQIMAWCCPGNKPLSGPLMVSLLMHICITRPQWINHHKNIPVLEIWHLHFKMI